MALSKPATTGQAFTQLLFKIAGNGSLRGTMLPDGGMELSIIDFISKTCQKTDGGAYARQQWLRMQKPSHEHYNEVVTEVVPRCHSLVLQGSGGQKTPCTDIQGLQRILTILGGKVAAEYRRILNDLFLRYMAGDLSMISELEDNAASDAPANVLARDALTREPVPVIAAPEPQPAIGDDKFAIYANTPPKQLLAIQETWRADADAEYKRAEARVLVANAEAEVESKLVDIFGRRISFEKNREEIEQKRKESASAYADAEDLRKRKAMDDAEELGSVIKRFASSPQAERELHRYDFSARLVSLIPSKRTRERFVMKLVKATTAPTPTPTPTTATKAGVYVLKLEDGTYYVGESTQIDVRIAQHQSGTGASFTVDTGANAVRVDPLTSGQVTDLEAWERAETLERMYKHGINNVRGWIYVTPVLSPQQREEAFQQICSRKKLCSTCGRSSHFSAQCFANGKAGWLSNSSKAG